MNNTIVILSHFESNLYYHNSDFLRWKRSLDHGLCQAFKASIWSCEKQENIGLAADNEVAN